MNGWKISVVCVSVWSKCWTWFTKLFPKYSILVDV